MSSKFLNFFKITKIIEILKIFYKCLDNIHNISQLRKLKTMVWNLYIFKILNFKYSMLPEMPFSQLDFSVAKPTGGPISTTSSSTELSPRSSGGQAMKRTTSFDNFHNALENSPSASKRSSQKMPDVKKKEVYLLFIYFYFWHFFNQSFNFWLEFLFPATISIFNRKFEF